MCKYKRKGRKSSGKSEDKHAIWPFIIGSIIIPILVLYIVNSLALSGQYVFISSADQWIALIGAVLSYAGTCFIGIIAMWQNKKLSSINTKLIEIEETRDVPQFNCKAGFMSTHSGRGTNFRIILEHFAGNIAVNPKIENLEIQHINGICTPSTMGPLPSRIKKGGSWHYDFTCNRVLDDSYEVYVTFTLCCSSILGKEYKKSYKICFKNRSYSSSENPVQSFAASASTSANPHPPQ